ncbi:acylphosphatase [Flavisolibacter sp. BT320]|nr:acylphosphatase [Flavisolibacter longurius]
MPTQHLLIQGTVQGVYYRASAKKVAEAIGVVGWIRNTPEGHVEAVVTGEPYQLQDFSEWCRKGPSGANVKAVDVEERSEEFFGDFRIIRG